MTLEPQQTDAPGRVTIRPAGVDDTEVLARHRTAMFRDMGVESETDEETTRSFVSYVRESLPDGRFECWVAESDVGPVGSGCALVTEGPPFAHNPSGRVGRLFDVFVEPEWRGRGVAKLLVRTILDELATDGVGSVGLVASEAARPVYERLGFEAIPEMRRSLAGWPTEADEA